MENVSRMKELISRLNQAAKVYYQGQGEVMSNFEYDKLYDGCYADCCCCSRRIADECNS